MAEVLTVLEVVSRSASFLEKKGIENGRLNAELLIAGALGLKRMDLYMQFDRPLAENELAVMRASVTRRGKREPLQYVLGEVVFCALNLKVDPRVLIPRPETELLVEKIVEAFPDNGAYIRILDLGTGSGAIALALAFFFPQAAIVAVDASQDALDLAGENAVLNGLSNRVDFRRSNWFDAIMDNQDFDLIVSNPPYLTQAELKSAEPEVSEFEPEDALVAMEDGLADLEVIIRGARERLNKGGSLWLETGIDQRERLLKICEASGYARSQGLDDLSGRDRFIQASV